LVHVASSTTAPMSDERREGIEPFASPAAGGPHPLPALLQKLDREAWKDFYLEHRRLVRGILASFTDYGPELEDLTQQVFATAAHLVRSGAVVLRGQPSGLRAWLAAIADRHGRDERRRRRGARYASTPNDVGERVDAGLDPVVHQTLNHARQVWERLPEPLQSPWILRHLERMTVDEIARTLEISAATVKRRLTEANAQFESMANLDPVLVDYFRDGGPT
jgi:RNA polymerase sigma-70 factor, ECF subfamily